MRLEAGISLRDQNKTRAVPRFGVGEGFFQPRDIRRHPFVGLGIHFGRAAAIVVAADEMHGHERDVVQGPGEVLAEFRELRIARLTFDGHGLFPETAACRVEHLAHLGEPIQRVHFLRLEQVAIGPVIVARRQDKRMARLLELRQDFSEAFVGARHRAGIGTAYIPCVRVIPLRFP